MATLKNLKGTAIQFLDADPVVYAGSWASGASVNTGRRYTAGLGSTTASLMFGGTPPPAGASVTAITESYNGTAWTEVADLNAAQNAQGSAGTLTSGMSALGAQSPGSNVEDWNGSAWSTNPHSLNSARQFPGGDGPSNDSAIMVGGEPAPNGALTEIYNGSSWTESGDLNTARNQLAAAGTTTALIAMGGNTGADAETFNGSSWTAVSDMNTGRQGLGGSGNSTAALAFAGGSPTAIGNSEAWNGSAWTEVNDLSSARRFFASSNIVTGNTSAYAVSGLQSPPANLTSMEIWSFPPVTASIVQEGDMWFNSASSALKGYGTAAGIPAATWASGGSINSGRKGGGGAGIQTSSIIFGGILGPGTITAVAETYNGTSFTEVSDLNTARRYVAGSGAVGTAAIAAGGQTTTTNPVANTETWNGSSWSETADINTARAELGGAGFAPSSASLVFAGYTTTLNANTESWNGTSWTEVSDLNTARRYATSTGSGIQTSAIFGGGYTTTNVNNAETWDGSSWSEVAEINTARRQSGGGSANNNSAIIYGGYTTTLNANTESWNGSSWTEVNDLSTARLDFQRAGTATGALGAGGETGTVVANTEEFTASAAVVTVTTS